jgi:hypothetical protein
LSKVPIKQITVPPVGEPQVPGELEIDVKVAPLAGTLAVNVTPDVGSGPLFTIV